MRVYHVRDIDTGNECVIRNLKKVSKETGVNLHTLYDCFSRKKKNRKVFDDRYLIVQFSVI